MVYFYTSDQDESVTIIKDNYKKVYKNSLQTLIS